ncbi:VOC family protein [Bdellovibrionota bacterium FG-2]
MAYLSHIGIAVENLDKLKPIFDILGMSIEGFEDVPTQGVRAHFVPLQALEQGQASRLELLECTDPLGPIAKFITKKGPGVHHLAFGVAKGELDAVCERIRAAGYQFTFSLPQRGAHSMRVNFVHPATTGGVLVEVMEPG